jgi:hypothetical protein
MFSRLKMFRDSKKAEAVILENLNAFVIRKSLCGNNHLALSSDTFAAAG